MISLVSIVTIAFVCLDFNSFSLKYSFVRENVGNMIMKGKGNRVPIDRRGEYKKQKEIMEAKEKFESSRSKDSPIFKVFVRPKTGGFWISCGDLVGDTRATALVNAWLSGFLEDMYKSQLDKGVARSIYSQEDSFVKSITENFRPYKKYTKDQLQFGYKIEFAGVVEKKGEQKVTELRKGMDRTWFDEIKDSVQQSINDVFQKG